MASAFPCEHTQDLNEEYHTLHNGQKKWIQIDFGLSQSYFIAKLLFYVVLVEVLPKEEKWVFGRVLVGFWKGSIRVW